MITHATSDVGLDLIGVLQTGSVSHVATLLLLAKDSSVLHRPVEIAPRKGRSSGKFLLCERWVVHYAAVHFLPIAVI